MDRFHAFINRAAFAIVVVTCLAVTVLMLSLHPASLMVDLVYSGF